MHRHKTRTQWGLLLTLVMVTACSSPDYTPLIGEWYNSNDEGKDHRLFIFDNGTALLFPVDALEWRSADGNTAFNRYLPPNQIFETDKGFLRHPQLDRDFELYHKHSAGNGMWFQVPSQPMIVEIHALSSDNIELKVFALERVGETEEFTLRDRPPISQSFERKEDPPSELYLSIAPRKSSDDAGEQTAGDRSENTLVGKWNNESGREPTGYEDHSATTPQFIPSYWQSIEFASTSRLVLNVMKPTRTFGVRIEPEVFEYEVLDEGRFIIITRFSNQMYSYRFQSNELEVTWLKSGNSATFTRGS